MLGTLEGPALNPREHSRQMSMPLPTTLRLSTCPAGRDVPLPQNGSYTLSPDFVYCLTPTQQSPK